MAYINGREVLFSPIVNGVLDNEALQQADIYKKIFANEPLDLIIPDGVTILCENQNITYAPITTVNARGADVQEIIESFFQSTNVETVNFPKLKTINPSAFSGCSALTEINAPALTTIGNSGFQDCSALTEINAPALTTIGNSGFQDCSALTEINAPALTTIGKDAILNTSKLTNMIVGVLTGTNQFSFRQTFRPYNGSLTVLEVGNGTSADLYLQYSTNYTQSTLHAIIENLADLTGKTAKTFFVGDTNLAKIDDEHKTILNNKNWIYQ